MKTCFKCREHKPLSSFYRHAPMADGHLNKCKACTKSDARQHRAENLDRIQEYDRKRGQRPQRKKANRLRYRARTATPAGRKREWDRSKAWAGRNRLKRAAHVLTGNAIKSGRIIKQSCEACGSRRKIQAHHDDYAKPLEVRWLCRPCHGELHRGLNERRRSQQESLR